MRKSLTFVAAFVVSAVIGSLPAPARAQAPDSVDPWSDARAAYSAEDFDAAARFLVEAIHRDPENARYYLGLARAEYWRGDYDKAVYYYDLYLGSLAGFIAPDARAADRPDRVRSERNSANAERANAAAPVRPPEAAESAREALEARITEGPILATTGGGALALYDAMLRAGYAHPNLLQIRARLASALLAEATSIVDEDVATIPQLTLVQWRTQRDRFEAWKRLVPAPAERPDTDIPPSALAGDIGGTAITPWERADAHVAFCEGQIQALNENPMQAAERFRLAIEQMPEHLPARMGRLNALYRLGNAASTVASELDAFESALRLQAPSRVGLAGVYRAAFAAQAGDVEGASARLAAIFGLP